MVIKSKVMYKQVIERTKQFVKESFIQHPHYSFNDWSVMYNHSVLTQEIALKIAQEVDCDKILVSIGALLHDIGKTYEADPETLHKRHEEFNLPVSKEFLKSLNLQEEQFKEISKIVSSQHDSTEKKLLKMLMPLPSMQIGSFTRLSLGGQDRIILKIQYRGKLISSLN